MASPVTIGFPTQPNQVLSTASGTITADSLVVTPSSSNRDGKLFVIEDDGYIYLSPTRNLVLEVFGAVEGAPVMVREKMHYVADTQQWVRRGNIIYSKFGGEMFALVLQSGVNVVISQSRQELIISEQGGSSGSGSGSGSGTGLGAGHLEAEQGQTIRPPAPLTHFTVSAVINLEAPWNGRIVDKQTAGTGDGFGLDIHPAHAVRVISNGTIITASNQITSNRTAYVAATFGGGQSSIYVNGVKVQSARSSEPPQNGHPIRIGFDSNGQSRFPGIIRRARIYLSVFSDAQIRADYEDARANLRF